jgi:hypothetical protein
MLALLLAAPKMAVDLRVSGTELTTQLSPAQAVTTFGKGQFVVRRKAHSHLLILSGQSLPVINAVLSSGLFERDTYVAVTA